MINLGGNDSHGAPRIALRLFSDRSLSFTFPPARLPARLTCRRSIRHSYRSPVRVTQRAVRLSWPLRPRPPRRIRRLRLPHRPRRSPRNRRRPRRWRPPLSQAPSQAARGRFAGASVTLYRIGTTGYGSAPLVLGKAISAANGAFTLASRLPRGRRCGI